MDLDALLRRAVELGATDMHLKEGKPPILRRDGALGPMEGSRSRSRSATCEAIVEIVAQGRARTARSSFTTRATSTSRTRPRPAAVPSQRLPPARRDLVRVSRDPERRCRPSTLSTAARRARGSPSEHRGLILVTGATGSGKTTTLAAMIGEINRTRTQHIVTIEDPIEILHADDQCIVNQREVGLDTESFGQALRRALRQDPDVILIGELRDAETAQTALQAAESGHLVLSTMHTVDAAETVARMIEFFPEGKQQQIRSVMAGVLRGVVSQRLVPRVDGGRIAAVEVMVNNVRIADLIRENRAEQIVEAIEEGAFFDMQTFTKSLIDLVVSGDGRQGGRGERRDQPARLPRHARALAQAAGRRRDAGRRRGEPAGAERARDSRASGRPAARGMKRLRPRSLPSSSP